MIDAGLLPWLPTPPPHAGWIGLALMLSAPLLWGADQLWQRWRRRSR